MAINRANRTAPVTIIAIPQPLFSPHQLVLLLLLEVSLLLLSRSDESASVLSADVSSVDVVMPSDGAGVRVLVALGDGLGSAVHPNARGS